MYLYIGNKMILIPILPLKHILTSQPGRRQNYSADESIYNHVSGDTALSDDHFTIVRPEALATSSSHHTFHSESKTA